MLVSEYMFISGPGKCGSLGTEVLSTESALYGFVTMQVDGSKVILSQGH
jgi:hypothetical protein